MHKVGCSSLRQFAHQYWLRVEAKGLEHPLGPIPYPHFLVDGVLFLADAYLHMGVVISAQF